MKKFIKSIVFAAAMLLSVSVWAGNPENAPVCNSVQNVITAEPLTAPEVKDVQQVPCILVIHSTKCGDFPPLAVNVASSSDCDRIENWVYNVLAMVGC
ncbi:MAG: hypothetical protein NZ455_14670 [Bacteroidia bacterium]|nr:hypothetical protein [Bacteroidia bacterium]MDW8348053.1 hypothetical protein [Bacteroidia bacterium]